MEGQNAGFCVRDTGFSAVLGVSLRVVGRNGGFCARDTEFSAVLGVSLQVAVRIAGFCVCDTEFFVVLGVSLQMEGQNAGFCVRDTEFSAILCVSLREAVRIAVRYGLRMLAGDGWEDVAWLQVWLSFWLSGSQSRWLSRWLSGGQSDFESHDVVVHVEAVSDVEVALAEDVEAEVMVEADRRIVAVHVQFDTGPIPFNAPSCNLTHMSNFPHMVDLPCKSSLPHMSDRTLKQGSAESVALFRRKYIDFLKVKEQAAVVGDSFGLYGNISACLPVAVCNVIHMSLVELLLQICRRVHPVHHVLHLLRRQDFPICVSEHNLSHVVNAHDVLAGGL